MIFHATSDQLEIQIHQTTTSEDGKPTVVAKESLT